MLVELSPPAADEAALAELAAHLRLPSDFGEDPAAGAALASALGAALSAIEREYGRAVIRRAFRAAASGWNGGIALPMAPAQTVTGVALEAEDGARTPCAVEDFRLDPFTRPPRLALRRGRPAPTPPEGGMLLVDFEAGYGPAWTDAPPDLRMAALLMAAAIYENAGDAAAAGAPLAAEALLAPYLRVRP